MRQLITRLDDDLHARLKELSDAEGRSLNAVVVAALEQLVGAPVDRRATIRRKLRDAGALVVPPQPAEVLDRADVIAANKGMGPVFAEVLAAERDSS